MLCFLVPRTVMLISTMYCFIKLREVVFSRNLHHGEFLHTQMSGKRGQSVTQSISPFLVGLGGTAILGGIQIWKEEFGEVLRSSAACWTIGLSPKTHKGKLLQLKQVLWGDQTFVLGYQGNGIFLNIFQEGGKNPNKAHVLFELG